MYLVNKNNEQVRIDDGGNLFLNGKCVNGKLSFDPDFNLKVMKEGLEDGDVTEGIAVRTTGHLNSFEYGHTRDDDGKPVCTKVCTGSPAWSKCEVCDNVFTTDTPQCNCDVNDIEVIDPETLKA